jgi:hypothetical protein
MGLDNTEMSGLDSKARKVLVNIFDNWFPSASMALTNKTLTGNVTGDVIGDVTGDVVGNLTGTIDLPAADALVADEDMSDTDFASPYVTLNGTSSCAITNWTPTVGRTYFIHCVTSIANSPTVTLSSGGTWDGANDLATFDAVNEYLVVTCVAALILKVIANPDTVAFS